MPFEGSYKGQDNLEATISYLIKVATNSNLTQDFFVFETMYVSMNFSIELGLVLKPKFLFYISLIHYPIN